MELRFMDNKKDNKYYALSALESIEMIQHYIKGISYEEFINDTELNDAIMFRFVQLGECIKCIGSEVKELYPSIPWGQIIGFRNGIVHEYRETNYVTVYETIVNDLAPLKDVLENIE